MKSQTSQGNLTNRTLAGLRWTYIATFTSFGLQLIYQAVINRMLLPAAFGLMQIAGLTLQFSKYFAAMGVGQAIIQKRNLEDIDVRVAFTSSVLLGICFSSVIWMAAPIIGDFFNEPSSVAIVQAMGLSLTITSFGVTAQNLLRREMRFYDLAIREIVSYTVGYLIVGLTCAFLGLGVWSLVAASLTAVSLGSLLAYTASRHTVVPSMRRSALTGLYGFGSRVSLISFMEFLGSNLDTIAVGRYAGTSLLGQYGKAYYLTNLPTSRLTSGLSDVLFPSFSKLQDEVERTRRAYISAITVAAFLLLPICTGIAVANEEIGGAILGNNFDQAIAVLPILAIAAGFSVLSKFAGVLAMARAELNRKALLQASYLVAFVSFLFIARGRGLWAYAAALAAGEFVRHVMYVALLPRLIELRRIDAIRSYVPGLMGATVVGTFIYLAKMTGDAAGFALVVTLSLEIIAGALGLLAALRLPVARPVRLELWDRLSFDERQQAHAGLARRVLASVVRP